jgi:branched-chain amino acid transport system permease protein
LLTIRLGNLYVALVTLTFGLLAETLIFTRHIFAKDGIGVPVLRPSWVADDQSFAYLVLAVFIVVSIIVVNLRRSTTVLAAAAVRFSEDGSRTIGPSVLGVKLLIGTVSTFIAAIGGGLLALNYQSAVPTSYATFAGLVWLAVFVTIGLRSITAAVLAGLSFTLMPGIVTTYLPTSWGNVPTLLFGLGAIAVAVNPDGQVAMNARQLQGLMTKLVERRKRRSGVQPPRQTPPLSPPIKDAQPSDVVTVFVSNR